MLLLAKVEFMSTSLTASIYSSLFWAEFRSYKFSIFVISEVIRLLSWGDSLRGLN